MSIVRDTTATLASVYEHSEARAIALVLCEHITGRSRSHLLAQNELQLSDTQQKELDKCVQRLLNEEPIQYIIGETDFYGIPFKVDKRVLIPRAETEELVDWIIGDHRNSGPQSIIDLCTGSGCIAVSLAKNLPNKKVSACDISTDALAVASENANSNKVDVELFKADVLSDDLTQLLPDANIIVSNPPYVMDSEKSSMHANVMNFEPHLALFVTDNDPLCFYNAIGKFAINKLSSNGSLYVEINRAKGDDIINLFQHLGFGSVELRKDLLGNDRMVKAIKND